MRVFLIVEYILYGSVIFNLVEAVSVTIKRERELVAQGEAPLPTSSYIYLVSDFIIRLALIAFVFMPIQDKLISETSLFHLPAFVIILGVTLLYMLLYYVSKFLLTFVMTVVVYIHMRRKKKKD